MTSQVTIVALPRPWRPRWLAKRSRVTCVLLFGWLAFWVSGILQPSCAALASFSGDTPHVTQVTAKTSGALEGLHQSPSLNDGHCPEVVSSGTILPAQFLTPAPAAGHLPYLVVASYIELIPAASEIRSSFVLDAPPPSRRLYLHTQRLLI